MVKIELENICLKYPAARSSGLKQKIANILKNKQSPAQVRYQLNNISFSLCAGQRMAVLGPNGSGKTTLLSVLSGVHEPNYGSLIIYGKRSSFIQISAGMNHLMTGEENVKLNGMYRAIGKSSIDSFVDTVQRFSDLGDWFYQPIKTYSSGMQVRLAFAMSTEANCEVLIMDEWLGAGDRAFIDKATERMNLLAMNAKILILATHSMALAREWCNCAILMDQGSGIYYPDVEDAIAAYESQ